MARRAAGPTMVSSGRSFVRRAVRPGWTGCHSTRTRRLRPGPRTFRVSGCISGRHRALRCTRDGATDSRLVVHRADREHRRREDPSCGSPRSCWPTGPSVRSGLLETSGGSFRPSAGTPGGGIRSLSGHCLRPMEGSAHVGALPRRCSDFLSRPLLNRQSDFRPVELPGCCYARRLAQSKIRGPSSSYNSTSGHYRPFSTGMGTLTLSSTQTLLRWPPMASGIATQQPRRTTRPMLFPPT